MSNHDDRIDALHPTPGKQPVRIKRHMYEPVRKAILDAVAEADELPFGQLREAVAQRTPASLWSDASVGWYTTTVKLDLEARGLIERVPGAGPQRLRRSPRH